MMGWCRSAHFDELATDTGNLTRELVLPVAGIGPGMDSPLPRKLEL